MTRRLYRRPADQRALAVGVKPRGRRGPTGLGEGSDAVHRPCALRLASTTCARANSCAICAATSGKRLGSTPVGASGQTMRTAAGRPRGSTNSIFRWSWLIWAEAKGVMGEDWDTAELAFRLGPGERLHRKPGPTYLVTHEESAPAQILRVCCAQLLLLRLNLPLTRRFPS
jgi:hypothetical protein